MHRWSRPVPLIGDASSAGERAADPSGWALPEGTQLALDEVLAARRDVRRFRPDPVPPELLEKVLRAGHQAPSVGHSQPWRFIVVTAAATRDRAAVLADTERLRQAEQLTPERGARLRDLQLEGIREAPLGIVLACDRRAPAPGVLGRATFADADLWSCACAIQNMWLTARAAGLGMGWVTLFNPADLATLLALPEGVESLGWLCLGWPDERPPQPGLVRNGWSQRLPLEEVVFAERWPVADAPAPISHLADPLTGELAAPDQAAVVGGRDDGDDLLTVPGSLGVLDNAINRVLALSAQPPSAGTLLIAIGVHPVTAHGISPYPSSVGADVLGASREGVSLGASAAAQAGLALRVIDAGAATGDLVGTDAMSAHQVDSLIAEGDSLGRALAKDGMIALGEVGIGNTTVAATLVHALLGLEVSRSVGLGAGADAAMVERKQDVVRLAVARARSSYGAALAEPRVALAALGGPELALLCGVCLGAAAAGVPVVLDGLVTSVAALLAMRIQPSVQSALVAGQRSREQAHAAVLIELGLEPLLDLRLRAGEGVGAALAAQLLLTGLRTRHSTARVTPS